LQVLPAQQPWPVPQHCVPQTVPLQVDWQLPFTQASRAPQALAQPPQFFLSLDVSTQASPHRVSGSQLGSVQLPATQVWLPVQA
jgi:hypothetical protein